MTEPAYVARAVHAPRASGTLLKLLASLVEFPLTRGPLAQNLFARLGIPELRRAPTDAPPSGIPPVFDETPRSPAGPAVEADALLALGRSGALRGPYRSAGDYRAAYAEGRADPVAVVERLLEALADSRSRKPALHICVAQDRGDLIRQAEASAERLRRGEPLGPLEGVPVFVKDELDMLPYPTTVGTRFLGTEPASADAEPVARLRRAGALMVAKVNMHEIGLGTTGLNPNLGTARNPWDPGRLCGGSSSGSGAAVGAGLGPIALGADGGGSIRIPAAFCGVFGIKPTFGRVSEVGAAPLCWSLAHVGPLAATAADLALAYSLVAGPDPADALSLHQPSPELRGLGDEGLAGLRIGVFRPWFEHAQPAVVAACDALLQRMVEAGAELREIVLPGLDLMGAVHMVTIVSEMAAAHHEHYRLHRKEYGTETRLNLGLARRLAAYDYPHAQRHRTEIWRTFARALADVDVIATPATGCVAPPVPEDALHTGESNLALTLEIMRFAQAANLTGLPALSLPAGTDPQGLPIGLQLMGRAWEESLLLRIALQTEAWVERGRPQVLYDPLGGAPSSTPA